MSIKDQESGVEMSLAQLREKILGQDAVSRAALYRIACRSAYDPAWRKKYWPGGVWVSNPGLDFKTLIAENEKGTE